MCFGVITVFGVEWILSCGPYFVMVGTALWVSFRPVSALVTGHASFNHKEASSHSSSRFARFSRAPEVERCDACGTSQTDGTADNVMYHETCDSKRR